MVISRSSVPLSEVGDKSIRALGAMDQEHLLTFAHAAQLRDRAELLPVIKEGALEGGIADGRRFASHHAEVPVDFVKL